MNKKIIRYSFYVLLIGLLGCLLVILLPRSYDVPAMQKRKGIAYWDLPTGSKIAYTKLEGKGKRKPYPIVFLQGGPGGFISERTINMLAPLTAEGYTLYLYDQIGSGHSERLSRIRDYTADRHLKDLEELVKKIGTEKVILIGQSWGAILATLFVANNPTKVDKIILTGAGPIYPIRENYRQIPAPDSLNLRQELYTNKEANEKSSNFRIEAIKYCAKNFGIKLASDDEVDEFQTYLNSSLNKAVVCDTSKALKTEGGGGFYAQVMTIHSLPNLKDIRPKLSGLKIPILLMRGQCDNQPWGFLMEYSTLFPNHELKVIPGAGHSIAVEQPELYLQSISVFLKKNTIDYSWQTKQHLNYPNQSN